MRRRKAERCVLRAEVALEAGFVDEARAALEEARRLDSTTLTVEELQARVVAARAPIVSEPIVSEPEATAPPHRWRVPVAAAALMAVAAFAGWSVMRRPSNLPASPAVAHRDVILPAAGVQAREAPSVTVKTELTRAEVDTQALADVDPSPTAPAVLIDAERFAPPVVRAAERPVETPLAPLDGLTPPPEPVKADPAPALPVTPLAASNIPGDVPVSVPPSPAPAAAPPPKAEPVVDEVVRVRSVLSQYESAYSNLDASAARAVWPAVDERALTRAFSGLQSQRLSLGRCDVAVKGATAQANCLGHASWTPKVGSGRTEVRHWDFTLQNAGGAWKIVRAEAR